MCDTASSGGSLVPACMRVRINHFLHPLDLVQYQRLRLQHLLLRRPPLLMRTLPMLTLPAFGLPCQNAQLL